MIISQIVLDTFKDLKMAYPKTTAKRRQELKSIRKKLCYYREEKFVHADEETALHTGDEIVILTHSKNLEKLEERWKPRQEKETLTDVGSEKKSNRK